MTPERWRQIDQLLDAALELEPGERAAFVHETCGLDDALRKEVEALLAANALAEDFIELPAAAEAARVLGYGRGRSVVGHRLGPYRVLSLLGEGGMGEVYLAEDSRLGRRVALKLLPKELARDADRLARFEREARAASALNHPSVCTVFDVGETEHGQNYIAMEHIQGETLRVRLLRGPMALSEALAHAREVAQALAAAHEAGIVHRDIKPDNVMVRPDGHVKVLDFGIAKMLESVGETPMVDAAAPSALRQTGTGHVVGTVGYMSPEQAKGEHVDQRSDIFSFGVMFYEMLTGETAFRRETAIETLRAIADDEPANLSGSRRSLPAEIEVVLRRCLEKDPDERYTSGIELAAALDHLHEVPRSNVESAARGRLPRRLRRWSIGLAAAAVLIAGAVWLRVSVPAAGNATAPAVAVPAMVTIPLTGLPGDEYCPALSPDGSQVAFTWTGEANELEHVYVRAVDGGTPLRLTTNEGNAGVERCPRWSPDGRTIAFTRFAAGKESIFTIPAKGGPERMLFATEPPFAKAFIDWSPDGYVVYSHRSAANEPYGLCRISVETLETQELTSPPAECVGDEFPAVSPDGRMLAFARNVNDDASDLYVMPATGGEPVRLTFNKQHIEGLAWAPDGRSIVFAASLGDMSPLWRISASGGERERLGLGGEVSFQPSISRQGNRLAYGNGDIGTTSTWRIDVRDPPGKTDTRTELLSTTASDREPEISPDGKKIAFASHRSGAAEIWMCDSDGSNPLKVTNANRHEVNDPRWSPDGRLIAYTSHVNGQNDIYVIGETGGMPRQLTEDPASDVEPCWSADGRWIYFASTRSGEWQVWKMSADGGEATRVTEQGGFAPFASPDGRYLYYEKEIAAGEAHGVWRAPIEGGTEALVMKGLDPSYWGQWAVVAKGIYFVGPNGKTGSVIQFYSATSRRVTKVAEMESRTTEGPTLAVAPDARWLLYTQSELSKVGKDIFLVENFR